MKKISALLALILFSGILLFSLTGCTPQTITTTAVITTTQTTTAPPTTLTSTFVSTTTDTTTLPPQTITAIATTTETTTATMTVTTVLLPAATIQGQISQAISPADAYQMIQDNVGNTHFLIIDVRTPDEIAQYGKIADSVAMDYNGGVFASQIVNYPRCYTYLVYCQSGVRSLKARIEMQALYFQEVYDISGGFDAWLAARFPTVSS